MSTDTFEDQLRSLLHDTADAEGPAYVDVDPRAVVTSGRRVIRRRRMVAGAGIAAAALAIGLVGWANSATGTDRGAAPVPAASVTARSAVTAVLERGTTLEDASGKDVVTPGRVRVGIDPASRTWSHAFVDDDGTAVGTLSEALPAGPRADWSASSGGPGVVMGLLPERATAFLPVWWEGAPASTQATAPLPGTGYESFALWHSGGPEAKLIDIVWTDSQQVYSSRPAKVHSAKFGKTIVFVDEASGQFGIFDGDGSVIRESHTTPVDVLPAVVSGTPDAGANSAVNTVLILLPPDADRAEVKAAEGATLLSAQTAGGQGTNRMLVLARLRVPSDSPDIGIDYVRWTDSNGTLVLSQVG